MAIDWIVVVQMTLVCMAWSRLYRPNLFYRISENLIVGWLIAFTFVNQVQIIETRIWLPLIEEGQVGAVIIPLVLGLLYWVRPFRQTAWLSRWSISLMTGTASAVAVKGALYASIISLATSKSFFAPGVDAAGMPIGLNNLIVFLFTFFCMIYFTFTYKHEGILGIATKIGLYMLMLAFGWAAGTYLMSLSSMSIGHMQTMMQVPGIYVAAVAIVLLIITILNDTGIVNLTQKKVSS